MLSIYSVQLSIILSTFWLSGLKLKQDIVSDQKYENTKFILYNSETRVQMMKFTTN